MIVTDSAIAVWKAFYTRDPELIRSVLTEDVEWIAPDGNATATALGAASHMIGPAAIIAFIINDFRRLYPNGMSVEPISVTAQDNRVVFEQRQLATLANGRSFDLAYVFIFEMENGRARRIREYMDTRAGLEMVFGGDPPAKIV
ncbi:MAG: nuclear transport factor 2 family protein [Sphingomicrobium sp.]|nr:nuclear transport factor 2 family protein [Sphingomonadales bacterium]